MDSSEILNFVGAIGLGSILGVIFKSYFDHKITNRKMLFEARIKAYTGLTARVFNLFQEIDIQSLPDPIKWTEINKILSEAQLLSTHELAQLIGEYKVEVFDFHLALGNKDDKKSEKLHKEVTVLAGKIHDRMRKDMHIDKKSVFEN